LQSKLLLRAEYKKAGVRGETAYHRPVEMDADRKIDRHGGNDFSSPAAILRQSFSPGSNWRGFALLVTDLA